MSLEYLYKLLNNHKYTPNDYKNPNKRLELILKLNGCDKELFNNILQHLINKSQNNIKIDRYLLKIKENNIIEIIYPNNPSDIIKQKKEQIIEPINRKLNHKNLKLSFNLYNVDQLINNSSNHQINTNNFIIEMDSNNKTLSYTESMTLLHRYENVILIEVGSWNIEFIICYSIKFVTNSKKLENKYLKSEISIDNFINFYKPGMKLEINFKYIGNNIEKFNNQIVEQILSNVSPEFKKKYEWHYNINKLSKILSTKNYGLKSLLIQAKTLTRNNINYINNDYFISNKMDGQRVIIWIKDRTCKLITSSNVFTFPISLLNISTHKFNKQFKNVNINFIAEGELMNDINKYDEINIYLIHVIVFEGNYVFDKPFEYRLDLLEEFSFIINSLVTNVNVKPNKYIRFENFNETLLFDYKDDYRTDGYILTDNMGTFSIPNVYKWKPNNTIDLLVIRCPKKFANLYSNNNSLPYLLFCGIQPDVMKTIGLRRLKFYRDLFPEINDKSKYFPIQFSPCYNPNAFVYNYGDLPNNVNYKICEFEIINDKFKFMRIRSDRNYEENYFGNNHKIAEDNYMIYKEPLLLHEIQNNKSNNILKINYIKKNILKFYNKYFKDYSKINFLDISFSYLNIQSNNENKSKYISEQSIKPYNLLSNNRDLSLNFTFVNNSYKVLHKIALDRYDHKYPDVQLIHFNDIDLENKSTNTYNIKDMSKYDIIIIDQINDYDKKINKLINQNINKNGIIIFFYKNKLNYRLLKRYKFIEKVNLHKFNNNSEYYNIFYEIYRNIQ